MRNLLVGNGINIQFDTKNYSRQEIVLRLLKNCDRDDFPSHIIEKSLKANMTDTVYAQQRAHRLKSSRTDMRRASIP